MKAIVAYDKNRAIGYENDLLWKNKEDLTRFKTLTNNSIIIMGHKTFLSLPNQKPLPNRHNIVLSRSKVSYEIKNNTILEFCSFEDLCFLNDNIWVIGGQEIYNLFMPYIDEIYATEINYNFIKADKYFPLIDELEWNRVVEKEGEEFNFIKYIKRI